MLQRYDLEQPEFSSPVDEDDERISSEDRIQTHTSLLGAALEREGYRASESPFEDDYAASQTGISLPSGDVAERLRERRSSLLRDSVLRVQPPLESPFGGSYGAISDSLPFRANNAALQHPGRLFHEEQSSGSGSTASDKERTPLLVKHVKPDDGNIVREPRDLGIGQSTLPQTIFNSVNALIGVGLLSLPLAIRYSGWVIGLLFFLFSAITTSYTAKLLAKCLDLDSTLITYGDLAFISFGSKARIATSLLFTLELLAVCVALVILFADSIDALIPGYGITEFKVVCGIILIPLCFVPLRFLSYTSAIGILCGFGSEFSSAIWRFKRQVNKVTELHHSRCRHFRRRHVETTSARISERSRDHIFNAQGLEDTSISIRSTDGYVSGSSVSDGSYIRTVAD